METIECEAIPVWAKIMSSAIFILVFGTLYFIGTVEVIGGGFVLAAYSKSKPGIVFICLNSICFFVFMVSGIASFAVLPFQCWNIYVPLMLFAFISGLITALPSYIIFSKAEKIATEESDGIIPALP